MHPSEFPKHPAAFREDVSETELATGYNWALGREGSSEELPES